MEKCGRRKEFTAARIRTTCCAKLTLSKGCNYEGPSVEAGRRKNKIKNKTTRGTRRGRMLGRRQLMSQENPDGIRNRDFREHLRLGDERTARGIYRKSTCLEIAKRIARYAVGLKITK
jgi:hypothetical protein